LSLPAGLSIPSVANRNSRSATIPPGIVNGASPTRLPTAVRGTIGNPARITSAMSSHSRRPQTTATGRNTAVFCATLKAPLW
jgi:hypothetical protein